MDYSTILSWLGSLNPIAHAVLVMLGCLVVLGGVYVKLTPSSKTSAWILKIESLPVISQLVTALMAFSPVQRKDQ